MSSDLLPDLEVVTDWNVHIMAYDDNEQLARALRSIPRHVPVHVFDGRYASFPGEYDTTPGMAGTCVASHIEHIQYHRPHTDQLPFGHEYDDPTLRGGVHEKAKWALYETLPQDEWTLKLDTDERLVTFRERALLGFDPKTRYRPGMRYPDGRDVVQARLVVPEHWSVWIDDTFLPRDEVPRDTPLADLKRQWATDRYRDCELHAPLYVGLCNHEHDRGAEWAARRDEQLAQFES